MKKTFYTVKYAVLGSSYTHTDWFDSKEEANSFYKGKDHCDKPVRHTYSNEESIIGAEIRANRDAYYRQKAARRLAAYNAGCFEE